MPEERHQRVSWEYGPDDGQRWSWRSREDGFRGRAQSVASDTRTSANRISACGHQRDPRNEGQTDAIHRCKLGRSSLATPASQETRHPSRATGHADSAERSRDAHEELSQADQVLNEARQSAVQDALIFNDADHLVSLPKPCQQTMLARGVAGLARKSETNKMKNPQAQPTDPHTAPILTGTVRQRERLWQSRNG